MVFPATILNTQVELNRAGTWTDITEYVYARDGIDISRGRDDESSDVEPTTCGMTLDNRDGRFSPRNPNGVYYGTFGRNSQIRVTVIEETPWLQIDQVTGTTLTPTHVSTTDKATLDIVGDIDLRFDADLESWRDGMELISKWTTSGNQRSYNLFLYTSGQLGLFWSTNGTNELGANSTLPVPITSGRLAVRAVLDVDNGAAGKTATFYVSDSISGSWTQLGTAVTTAGTTSIFSSSATVHLLDNPNAPATPGTIHGRVFAAQIRNSAGTVVANPDFTIQTVGATSFADTAGTPNTWTVNGADLRITRSDRRFIGEVANWPQRWDQSGSDIYAPITAAGVLRRLLRGNLIGSASYRWNTRTTPTLLAYWPMEDAAGSTQLSSGIPGGVNITPSATTDLAAYTGIPGSNALPTIGQTPLIARIPRSTVTGALTIQFMVSIPAAGLGGGSILMQVMTDGTAERWDLLYVSGLGGELAWRVWDNTGAIVTTTAASVGFDLDGVPTVVELSLVNNGADVLWTTTVYPVAGGLDFEGGTVAGKQLGAPRQIVLNATPATAYDQVAIGHVAVYNAVVITAGAGPARGFKGEFAAARIARLCGEEGITFSSVGPHTPANVALSGPLGPQTDQKLVDLLRDAAGTDLGILYEPRDLFGLAYRSRAALYAPVSELSLDYALGELSTMEPVEDDQLTVNDMTVSRVDGGSARYELTSGALSTLAPPNGVGRYPGNESISLYDDTTLQQQARFRVALGTVDEARYPVIELTLENSSLAAKRTLIRRLEPGDQISITNPPAWLDQVEIRQLVQGYREHLGSFSHTFSLNCSPATPWNVGIYNDFYALDRYGSGGSTLNETLDTTETGVDVTCTRNQQRWTTTAASWPFDIIIGGEIMRVTAVSGAGLSQTLTVTRSINGVVKNHNTIGVKVELARLSYYAL